MFYNVIIVVCSRTSCETAFGWWVILGKYVLIKNKNFLGYTLLVGYSAEYQVDTVDGNTDKSQAIMQLCQTVDGSLLPVILGVEINNKALYC